MKPIKVEFLNKPNIEPITEYKKCPLTFYLLDCTFPKYRLLEGMKVVITFDNGRIDLIKVKKGYECDLASIPRVFWSIYPPDGAYRYAAILHDVLYQSEKYLRSDADMVFKLGMSDKVPVKTKDLFYLAVRVGGFFVWHDHTKESINEAKRYLKIKSNKGV